MARSYLPSKVSEIVAIWRKDLSKVAFYANLLLCLHDNIAYVQPFKQLPVG